jgi:hypothetical protein
MDTHKLRTKSYIALVPDAVHQKLLWGEVHFGRGQLMTRGLKIETKGG